MNTLYIEDEHGKRTRYEGPSKWNELNEFQLLAWAGLSLKKLDALDMIRAVFVFFYGIPAKWMFIAPNSEVIKQSGKISFLFEKNELNRWVIPQLRIWGKTYYGPADALTNISIGEYRRTELYYQAYAKSNQVKFLYLLAATLYREKRKDKLVDDIREDLTEFGVQKRGKRFEGIKIKGFRFGGVDRKFLQAVLLNYEGCRGYITSKFSPIFENRENGKNGKDELFDFEEVIDAVAGGPFGDAEKTEKTPLYRFLRHLVKQKEAADAMERRSKSR